MIKINKKIRYILLIIAVILIYFDGLYLARLIPKSVALLATILGIVLLVIASFSKNK